MNYQRLQQWMGDNCDLCRHVGDWLWIAPHCPIAFRIVWGDNPYSDEDEALIGARLRLKKCPNFSKASWRVRRLEQALELRRKMGYEAEEAAVGDDSGGENKPRQCCEHSLGDG